MTTPVERPGAPLRPANVLVVDDQPANVLVLTTLLDDLGVNVLSASSGEEALRLCENTSFAVVILDVIMPGVDGFETARRIRALKTDASRAPIVFVTAFEVDAKQLEEGYSLGAVDFLTKPLNAFVVRGKIRSLIDLYEQKEKARLEADQLRLLIHGTTEYAIFLLDPNGYVVSWNPGAKRIKGYSAEEIIGRHFSCFYPQDAIDRGWPEHELEVARSAGRFEDEGWRIRKDGTRFWANVMITTLRDDAGNIRGFSKITRDLTERKRAEENARNLVREETARRAAEELSRVVQGERERFRVTLASIGDAVISTDPQERIDFLNSVAEQLTGWKQEEAIGRLLSDVFRIVNEQTRQPVENPAQRAIAEGTIVGLANHTILIARDGTERPIDDSAAAMRDAKGAIIGAVLVFRDITKRKRAEETTRFLADASSALAVLVDYESTLQKVASLAVPYFADWAAIDVIGSDGQVKRVAIAHADPAKIELAQDLNRRYPPQADAPIGVGNIIRTRKAEIISDVTNEVLGAAGHDEEWLRIMRSLNPKSYIGVPLEVRGKVMGVISFLTAESGYRYDSADLDVAEDLANRAAIAIENAQLYRESRDTDRRKDEFLAMLGHELRNPLAPIRNAVAILGLPNVDPQTFSEARQIIANQVNQLVRLVDDLLDMSRIMQGKIQLRYEPVELKAIVRRAIETSKPLIDSRKHELDMALPSEPIWLNADSVRLTQVLSNLLNNAAKYTEPGGKICVNVEASNGGVHCRVRDNGIGIPPDLLPNIFDLFTQADRSIERSQGGLGIGLTLVRRLVEMHGGTVSAKSEGPGCGSEFTVSLPTLRKEPDRQQELPLQPTKVRPLRVLVVEDIVGSARMLATMLRKFWEHEVRIAHDGIDALKVAESFRPELVLLDVGLPGISGYEVAKRMRRKPETAHAFLVALTGYGTHEDRRRAFDAGFDEHLAKPASVEELQRLFNRHEWAAT